MGLDACTRVGDSWELVLGGACGAGLDVLGGEDLVPVPVCLAIESALRKELLSLKGGIFSPGEAFGTERADFSAETGGLLILA